MANFPSSLPSPSPASHGEESAEVVAIATYLLAGTTISSVTGATTLTTAAFGTVVVVSGTAADYTVGLPTAVGNSGRSIIIVASTALTRFVTIDGNGSETVGGALTQTVWAGESLTLLSDGANWLVVNRVSRALACSLRNNGTGQVVATATLTGVVLNSADTDNSTRMADTANNRIVIRRAGNYQIDVSMLYNSPGAGQRYIGDVVVNGSISFGAETSLYVAGGFPNANRTKTIALAVGDLVTLSTYQNSGAGATVYGSAVPGDATTLGVTEVF